MSVQVSDIFTLVDKKRRDATAEEIDLNNKFYALQEVLDDIKSQHIFPWDIRTTWIKYYDTLTRYTAPSDFLGFIEPRPENRLKDMVEVEPDIFDRKDETGETEIYAVDWREREITLRLKTRTQKDATTLHTLNSYDGNGTWTAETSTSDATNVGTDKYIYRHNASSVSFDVDVSQSTNNYAELYVDDMTAVDLSDEDSASGMILDVYIPDKTYVTGFLLRWGSDSSNYWEKSITTQADGRAFEDGWNIILFDWTDATETGTVTNTAFDYILLRMTYSSSQADMKNCRINYLRVAPEEVMPVEYATRAIASTTEAGGTYKETIDSEDYFLLFSGKNDSIRDLVVYGTAAVLFDNSDNESDFLSKNAIYNNKLARLMERYPSRMTRASRSINLYVD